MSAVGRCTAITGAAGGIGRELCRHFAGAGHALAMIDRQSSVLAFAEELTSEGHSAAAAIADIADAEQVLRAFAELREKLGPVSVLINNAGFSCEPTLAKATHKGWAEHIAGNLNGAFHCSKAALPDMIAGGGNIVMIASVNGLMALGDPAYSAAKSGLLSLTRALAVEYGKHSIRANAVLPGTVRTPIWDERRKSDPKVLETLERWYPLGRIVEPSEVVATVDFLISDAAGAITGALIPVDCGLTAGNIVMSGELTLEDH